MQRLQGKTWWREDGGGKVEDIRERAPVGQRILSEHDAPPCKENTSFLEGQREVLGSSRKRTAKEQYFFVQNR